MGKYILDYNKACEKIVEKGCIPLFTSTEWKGHTEHKKKLKYWFQGICGHPFYASYGNVVSGHKLCCNNCGKNNQLNKQKLSEEEYLKYNNLFEAEKNITVLTKYIGYKNFRQKLECKCLTCNLIFNESIDNILKKDSHGCLSIPKGERITISLFEKNNIDYQYQVYISELNITSDFEIYLEDGKLKKKMNYADKLGINKVILVGEDEAASKLVKIKDMVSGEESIKGFSEI
jgi:hypothetical protein